MVVVPVNFWSVPVSGESKQWQLRCNRILSTFLFPSGVPFLVTLSLSFAGKNRDDDGDDQPRKRWSEDQRLQNFSHQYCIDIAAASAPLLLLLIHSASLLSFFRFVLSLFSNILNFSFGDTQQIQSVSQPAGTQLEHRLDNISSSSSSSSTSSSSRITRKEVRSRL